MDTKQAAQLIAVHCKGQRVGHTQVRYAYVGGVASFAELRHVQVGRRTFHVMPSTVDGNKVTTVRIERAS